MNARKIRLVKGDEYSCPKCGHHEITTRTVSDTIDFRGLELDVDNLHESVCDACGHVWTSAAQETTNHELLRIAYAGERDRLREENGLLSGSDIARIRNELGLSQREAAALFGGGFNAFNKYESGEVLQSYAMDRLLRLSKVIGKPVISFLRNVTAMPTFTVVTGDSQSSGATIFRYQSRSATAAEPAIYGSSHQDIDRISLLVHKNNHHIFIERAT